ncbi:alpha-E domain-containing protein [Acidocella sp.]|uniref:alpha-E domain-containing protein n=1 Tax=Acidocella sp. TaxID=50710 RepID=UPI0026104D02|nr:alpha-E domain-containing protein [Acidocella sp.]
MSTYMRDPGLLARDAEGLFWMARYLERVENLARLIDVTQSFESPGFEADAWWGLIRINADEENFSKRGFSPDAIHIKRFYLLDKGNPTSIPSSLEDARTNARTLRPLISTEMWRQINVFHRFVGRIGAADLEGDALSRVCTRLKDAVQAHTGITEGTLYRDQGWYFYELGRLLERADQTTRMLDIKYTALLPHGGREEQRVAELTQWHAVLRGAAGYHAFKRRARAEFSAEDVVHFLLRDASSPRSALLCVRRMESHLDDLRRLYGLHAAGEAIESAELLREILVEKPLSHILATGLHDYLDIVQIQLQKLAACIGRGFFRDWRPEPAATQTQVQAQA